MPDVGDEYDKAADLLKLRLTDASHQNWVFSDEDAKFLMGAPGPAFEQLSIQRLNPNDQRKLAEITGVLSRHKSKGKDEQTMLQFAAIITKEIDSGRGNGTTPVTTANKRDMLDGIALTNLLHQRAWILLKKKSGKSNCQIADGYTESKDAPGHWTLPFFRRVIAGVKGEPTDYEDGADRKVLTNDHHAWLFAVRFNCVKGLPNIRAYCERPTKLIVTTPMLDKVSDVPVPSLFDVAYPGGVGADEAALRYEPLTVLPEPTAAALEKRRVVFTAETQRVIALRSLAMVHIMHQFGWAHNHITPHTLRLDASSMTVHLMDLTSVRAEDKPSAQIFDIYSLYATFKTCGLDDAAKRVAEEPVDPQAQHVDMEAKYQKRPQWKATQAAQTAQMAK